jgi:septal ring factor EnvC (AmiA/AmiB activator)
LQSNRNSAPIVLRLWRRTLVSGLPAKSGPEGRTSDDHGAGPPSGPRPQRQRAEAAARAAANSTAKPGERRPADTNPSKPSRNLARATLVQVGGLGWPLSGDLLAGYGARMPDGRTSSGLLIAAAQGSPVRAVADGSVVFAEWMTGYGLILILDHGDGTMSLYAHSETLLKSVGDRVRRGDPVARVGNSGGASRPALYFELRRDGRPVDPRQWFGNR